MEFGCSELTYLCDWPTCRLNDSIFHASVHVNLSNSQAGPITFFLAALLCTLKYSYTDYRTGFSTSLPRSQALAHYPTSELFYA